MKNLFPELTEGEINVLSMLLPVHGSVDIDAPQIIARLQETRDLRAACAGKVIDELALTDALRRLMPHNIHVAATDPYDHCYDFVDSEGEPVVQILGQRSLRNYSLAAHFLGADGAYSRIRELLKLVDRLVAIIDERDYAEDAEGVVEDAHHVCEDALCFLIDSIAAPRVRA